MPGWWALAHAWEELNRAGLAGGLKLERLERWRSERRRTGIRLRSIRVRSGWCWSTGWITPRNGRRSARLRQRLAARRKRRGAGCGRRSVIRVCGSDRAANAVPVACGARRHVASIASLRRLPRGVPRHRSWHLFQPRSRKDCFGHVHKAQWISMARRLSAGGPQNKSHSDHAGISKKKISENQITAQGRMNSAISPAQNITMIGLLCSCNMTFSDAIAVMNHRSTATPARRLKDPRFCVGGSPAAHRRRR